MTAIADFAAAQKVRDDKVAASLAAMQVSLAAIVEDIAGLKAKIALLEGGTPPPPSDAVAAMSAKLGPTYDSLHPTPDPTIPDIYLRPLADTTGLARSHYSVGLGTQLPDAGDFSTTAGQALFVPDLTLVVTPIPPDEFGVNIKLNSGIGVNYVSVIEMGNGVFTEAPQYPWNSAFEPDPAAIGWVMFGRDKEKIGQPIGVARCVGGAWGNSSLVLFDSGYIATGGTVTARSPWSGFNLPVNKKPTAIALTTRNELALVTVVDTTTGKGQLAVICLWGSGKVSKMPHDWYEAYPGMPNVAVFTGMKLLGYIDLPFNAPDVVAAAGGLTNTRVSNKTDGNAGLLQEYDLNVQADRDSFNTGNNAGYASNVGYAVVASKSENKAAFLDLSPWFVAMRTAFFTTQANFDATRPSNPGGQWYEQFGAADLDWPHTFAGEPALTPQIVKVVDITSPTSAVAIPGAVWTNGGAAISGADGKVTFFHMGKLAQGINGPPLPPDVISVYATVAVGQNPTCLAYEKFTGGLVACCRGDREIDFIENWAVPSVTHRLRDQRMVDPVYVESADTHGIEGAFITVCDFKGRKIINYRSSALTFATQGGAVFGMGPAGTDEFECGGVLDLPGAPFALSGSNVN